MTNIQKELSSLLKKQDFESIERFILYKMTDTYNQGYEDGRSKAITEVMNYINEIKA